MVVNDSQGLAQAQGMRYGRDLGFTAITGPRATADDDPAPSANSSALLCTAQYVRVSAGNGLSLGERDTRPGHDKGPRSFSTRDAWPQQC